MNYYNNDPLKLIMHIGVILYKFAENKLYIFLCENLECKYDLIYYDNNIIENIINRVYNATNYLILLDIDTVNEQQINDFYDELSFTLIKFIKLPDNYCDLKSIDFNLYEIISDDIKIKRELKWIELKYFNNFILKNNKVTNKLKNKDILKNLNKIHKNYILCLTLHKIKSINKSIINL